MIDPGPGTSAPSLDGRTDAYAATASHYDLAIREHWPLQREALRIFASHLPGGAGTVLDVGAGTGLATAALLHLLPAVEVLALEPSPAMRAVALSRIAAHPQWWTRVTLRPEALLDAPLPQELSGAVLLGVLGHLTPQQRQEALTLLASRFPSGAPVLLDLQDPPHAPLAEVVIASTDVGALTYRTSAQAWPLTGALARWRMTYQTLDGEVVVDEQVTVHDYHHPTTDVVIAEADAAGFSMAALDSSPTFQLLLRR